MSFKKYTAVFAFLLILSIGAFAPAVTSATTYAAKILDTTSTGGTGTGTNYSLRALSIGGIDGNIGGTDYNARLGSITTALYAIPNVAITSPANGSSQTSTTLTWDYNIMNQGRADLNSMVKKFWIGIDTNDAPAYYDNGLNLTYSSPNRPVGSHTLYVKDMNWDDKNVDFDYVTVTITAANTPVILNSEVSTGGNFTSSPGSSGAGVALVGKSIFTTTTVSDRNTVTADYIDSVLRTHQAPLQIYSDAKTTVDNFEITRTVKVNFFNGVYLNAIDLKVKNTGTETLENIKLFESIPKSIAANSDVISSMIDFTTLDTDPVAILFEFASLAPGEEAKVRYSVDQNLLKADVAEWGSAFAFVSTGSFEELCANVTCEAKSCQASRCNPFNGQCVYRPLSDATACTLEDGSPGSCSANVCQALPPEPTPPVPPVGLPSLPAELPPIDYTPVGILVVAVVLVIGFRAVSMGGKPKKGLDKFK